MTAHSNCRRENVSDGLRRMLRSPELIRHAVSSRAPFRKALRTMTTAQQTSHRAGIEPLTREQAREFEAIFQAAEQALGWVPNSMLTMARDRELILGFGMLSARAMDVDRGIATMLRNVIPMVRMLWDRLRGRSPERIDRSLRSLVSYAVSLAAGCRYCQAHTASTASRDGVSDEKIEAIFLYEESALYSDAERAALDLAFAAGTHPNASTGAHFEALRRHFSEAQILDIVCVISYFGFLNRWNDTLGTMLETQPRRFAAEHVPGGWTPGRHG